MDKIVDYYAYYVFPNPDNHPYYTPTPGKITIGAITPTETDAVPGVELCRILADAGFNTAILAFDRYVAGTVTNKPALLKTIENCRNAGIAPFITGALLLRGGATRDTFIDDCLSDEGFAGWWLPTADYSLWSDGKATVDPFNYIWNRAHSLDPDNQRMVVAPVYPSLKNTGAPDYGAYVNRFQTSIGPSVWIFGIDGSDDGSVVGEGIEKELGFLYRDCQIYSLLAQYCRRPFWFIVKSRDITESKETEDKKILYPVLYGTVLRMRAFTALAYGAQALLYDVDPADRVTMNLISTLNKEIESLNLVFQEAELVQVRHVGQTQYPGTAMLRGAFGPIMSIQAGEAGVVLTHLNNHGVDYVIVVSRSLVEETNEIQQVNIRFSDAFGISRFHVDDNLLPMESSVRESDFSCSLAPGEYLIFKWTRPLANNK